MYSILEEFFYGNISPEVQTFTRDCEYAQVMRVISSNEDHLLEKLSGEEKETLKKLSDAQMELNALTAVKSQIYGFQLGLLMTAETFITSKDIIRRG